MPFLEKVERPDRLPIEDGLEATNACQRECASWLGATMQMEHEAYLSQHPEIRAMLEVFLGSMTRSANTQDYLKEAGKFFSRPKEELDQIVRERLKMPEEKTYWKDDKPTPYHYKNTALVSELRGIMKKHYPPKPWQPPQFDEETPNTESSSFLSFTTSDTTLVTPEPIPTPPPTLSEIMYNMVSNNVDKAIYSHVDDYSLRYDTAYVELMKAVEDAMEIPVIEIREDIATLFYNAYKLFELDIMEKERIAAEIAWEKRMRKKLKRTLRRQDNFRGYETPPTPKSVLSSHESYKIPPPKPCVCVPKFYYNRYPKDRFGIYLPRDTNFSIENTTVTPAVSDINLTSEPNAAAADKDKDKK